MLLPTGEELVIENEKTEEGNRHISDLEGSETHPTASASEEIVPQKQTAVKPLVTDKQGNDLVEGYHSR